MGNPDSERVTTGVPGLDEVLGGGFPPNRMYLVQGSPGAGKTTLALQFLLEGCRRGERGLYLTLSETPGELASVARSHGWSLEGITIFEISSAELGAGGPEEENTLYVPAEVELGERMRALLAVIDDVKPERVVLDSCTELRLLAQNALRFRRQILALKEHLQRRRSTIVLLENPSVDGGDPLLQSLVHGVVVLQQTAQLYGVERRRLRVNKMREVAFRGGHHDLRIQTGGVTVYPRLVAAEHASTFPADLVSSGLAGLDTLAGGGLERGTSTLFVGPAGSGKSAVAVQYAVAAASRGEHASIFTFDEGMKTLFSRSAGLGMDLAGHHQAGRIQVQQVDPAELSPGEFVHVVRDAVERRDARVLVIDSINAYVHAMPEEHFLELHLHELLSYLRQRGVVLLMVVAQHGFVGPTFSKLDISYLADNVLLFRYFEAQGRVRRAVSMIKKRSGPHETTIRELTLSHEGVQVGPPLEEFRGVLTGVPALDGSVPVHVGLP